jgi:hypothetical protein
LFPVELSKDAQRAKQANWDDLQFLFSESATQIYFLNKCGMYQRVYAANPSNNTIHQSTRTLRIHNLYLVIRNFSGKMLVPAESKMYSPASSVTVPNAACVVASA